MDTSFNDRSADLHCAYVPEFDEVVFQSSQGIIAST
jgi:hypothetical protein